MPAESYQAATLSGSHAHRCRWRVYFRYLDEDEELLQWPSQVKAARPSNSVEHRDIANLSDGAQQIRACARAARSD